MHDVYKFVLKYSVFNVALSRSWRWFQYSAASVRATGYRFTEENPRFYDQVRNSMYCFRYFVENVAIEIILHCVCERPTNML